MIVTINPGSGPVDGALDVAESNIMEFIGALDLRNVTCARQARHDDHHGRFGYELSYEGRYSQELMPGVPLDVLKGAPRGFPPRLYVDGSSWMWEFAINVARMALTGEE